MQWVDRDRVTLKIANMEINAVTGITDGPIPSTKGVDYTITTTTNVIGLLLGIDAKKLVNNFHRAEFQKFDDGWRLIRSPLYSEMGNQQVYGTIDISEMTQEIRL